MRGRSLVVASVIIALGSAAIAAADGGAVAPKLEDIEPPSSGPPANGRDEAKPVPATVTICQDSSAQRCWTESGATGCVTDANPGARVFRRVGSNTDPGTALKDCWTAVRR